MILGSRAWLRYGTLLSVAVVVPHCHKQAAEPDTAALVAEANDAIKEQALRDLQSDVVVLRSQLSLVNLLVSSAPATTTKPGKIDAALYTCDRVAIAQKALSDDARAQSLLGEADAMCAYQAPIAAGQQRLAALEQKAPDGARTPPAECGPIRDVLLRVGAKYKSDDKLQELARRFKSDCPRVRLGAAREHSYGGSSGSSGSSSASRPDAGECRRRCDDAAFSCRSSCNYCGTCTSDKTWEWCNATCNNCKQGCEQNEKFCKASCGN